MITKGPTDKGNLTEKIWYFSAARTAFRHLLIQMEFDKQDVILLPSYIGITDREGSGVMDPIWDCGIKHDFFKIDDCLNADLSDLLPRIQAAGTKAVLLIHYFGFPQKDVFKIREFCISNNVHLIEDCAHSLYSKLQDTDLGSIGDFSFFSIHKSIPSDSGGFLRSNLTNFELRNPVEDSEQIELAALEVFTRVLSCEVAEKRITNYRYLTQLLVNCPDLTLMFPELPDGVVPLNLPVLIGDGQREALYFYLLEQGLPTIALYYRLIDELQTDRFEVSNTISQSILNLPIHQDINFKDLNKINKSIRQFISDRHFSSSQAHKLF